MRVTPILVLCAACGSSPPPQAAPPPATPTAAPAAPPARPAFAYPAAEKGEVVDDYHGTKVADPYRWMEDLDSPNTQAWIQAENQLTFDYLGKIPGRDKLKARLTALYNFERFELPQVEGKATFYERNTGLQNQSVLFVVPPGGGEPRQLLDPNTLSSDGTVALHDRDITLDGKLVVYGIANAGSDWVDYHVLRVSDGKEVGEAVKWNKFGGATWSQDGKGFYYSRYPEAKAGGSLKDENRLNKVYYHRLGTAQDKDELIYEKPDEPDWLSGVGESWDGRWLYLNISSAKSDKNLLYVREAKKPKAKWIPIADKFEDHVGVVGNVGSKLFVLTDRGAPRYHVVTVDVGKADAPWIELIPQGESALQSVTHVDHKLIANYLEDAHSKVVIFGLDGKKLRDVDLPGIGTAVGFGGHPDTKLTFYQYDSYTVPRTIYRYDIESGKSEVYKAPHVDFDASRYETRQVFFKSKDGTRVPIFVTQRRDLKLDGQNPTILYGYGGFDIPITPGFRPGIAAWLEAGGVYAVVTLRGGSEYGEAWHEAGMHEKKQNVFDDFTGAAEFLASEKITSPQKLCAQGGSNGGLLVGAVETQRPELFGCALPAVGVMDMLRFQKFTIGWTWASEYGSSDDPELFKAIRAYSPLHNIKAGTRYPATLVTTADHDDRVFPAHSFKFTATMQVAQAGDAPILIRVETRAGHGGGKPTSKIIEETTDELAFAAKSLQMTLPQ